MSWLPGANPAKVMSSIIRRRNGVIVISLRSKIGRGPPTQPGEEILSTVQISDAALTLGEAVSPTAEFQSLPPGSFPRYLDPKLLITLSFSPSGVFAAGEFTVYKRDRTSALSAHPAKNLILFSHLEGQGPYTNLPR